MSKLIYGKNKKTGWKVALFSVWNLYIKNNGKQIAIGPFRLVKVTRIKA